jgi:hypothetical protein
MGESHLLGLTSATLAQPEAVAALSVLAALGAQPEGNLNTEKRNLA